ncbi:hypothetical protein D3C84_706170 [compost metagenome]
MYQTLIFDEVYTSALYCQDFLCKKHGVETIGEGNDGFGLWKEYESEYWTEIDKLLGSGYTLIFISHEETTKEGKHIPKGDKRSIKPIIDNSDVVVYLTSNGVDEEGNVVKSSAWFAETENFFARSRFDYMDTYLEEFTAENLEKVIAEGIERQEKAEGIKAVSYFDSLVEQINELGSKVAEEDEDKLPDVIEIIEKNLGKGKKVSEAKKSQVDVLSIIFDELKDLLAE